MNKSMRGFFEPVTGIAIFLIFGSITLLLNATDTAKRIDTSDSFNLDPVIVKQQSIADNKIHKTSNYK